MLTVHRPERLIGAPSSYVRSKVQNVSSMLLSLLRSGDFRRRRTSYCPGVTSKSIPNVYDERFASFTFRPLNLFGLPFSSRPDAAFQSDVPAGAYSTEISISSFCGSPFVSKLMRPCGQVTSTPMRLTLGP